MKGAAAPIFNVPGANFPLHCSPAFIAPEVMFHKHTTVAISLIRREHIMLEVLPGEHNFCSSLSVGSDGSDERLSLGRVCSQEMTGSPIVSRG